MAELLLFRKHLKINQKIISEMRFKSFNYFKIVTGVLIVSLSCIQMATASVNVKGRVLTDKNIPIEFANVILLNSTTNELVKGEVSNVKGEFSISKILPGDYVLCASMIGYAKSEGTKIVVSEKMDQDIEKTIVLKETANQLKDVEITAKKQFIEQTVDKMVVNPDASITSESENVYEILKKLPGITIDDNGNISMKGKQGVSVLIDDKLTYLSGTELSTLLKSLQGKNINKIELIENPSAKFDAEGNSGIINIKTKHNKAPGFNGSVNAGVRQASKLGQNAGLDLNMNVGDFNVYGNYNFYGWAGWHALDADRKFTSPGLIGASQAIYNMTNYQGNGHNFKVGADYFITKNQVVSCMFRQNFGHNGMEENSNTSFFDIYQDPDSSLLSVADRTHNWNNKTLNFNYKWDIDSMGQSFVLDADYARFRYNSNSEQESENYDKFGNNLNRDISLESTQYASIRILSAKVDYVHPFGKIFNFESGLKASFVKTDNSAQMMGYVAQNDRFIYDENIQAAYVNGQLNLKNTSFQLGLRLENTNSVGKSISTNDTTTNSYLKLFPSFFVKHKINKNNDANLRYSYRIGRPRYNDLNPFIWVLDPYTYNQGNPLLRPKFTHSVGLTHSYKGFLNTSIGYNYTKDLFSQVLFQDDLTKIIWQTNQNLSNSTDLNVSETFQLEPVKWWRVSGTLTGMYKVVNANLGGEVQFENYSFMGNVNNTFTINKIFGMELNANYSSKQLNGNFVINPRYNVDFGAQCKLLDNKLILKASVNDIFNSNQTSGYSKYNNVDLEFKNLNDSRQLNLSVIYRFGKNEFKTRANRTTASSEEENRSSK